MNLAERMAANDDYGYDEDSVHTLLKKHEVCICRSFNASWRETNLVPYLSEMLRPVFWDALTIETRRQPASLVDYHCRIIWPKRKSKERCSAYIT